MIIQHSPSISVITVVYNGVDLLAATMDSVLSQTYPHIEYILVDGNSKDGTQSLIQSYEHKIAKWISEPDKGLYDAMNKGLKMATGDFVWFINAGDRIYTKHTVQSLIDQYSVGDDILYGEVQLVNEQGEYLGTRSELTSQKLPQQLSWRSLKYGMCVCHQAFLPRRELAPEYALDNLSADIEWLIQCLKKAHQIKATELILAEYLVGGLSKKRHWEGLKGRYKILKKYYGFIPNLFHHFVIVGRALRHKIRRRGKTHY